MKYTISMLCLLMLGCQTALKNATPVILDGSMEVDLSKDQIQAINHTLSVFPNESELSIAIVRGDQSIFYGLKRQNDTIRTIKNAQSVFEIGSITKVFTTHLLVNALNDQLIPNIEEPIQAYCPYSIKGNPNISFKQLANHTAGLPQNISGSIFNTKPSNPYANWDDERLRKYLQDEVEINNQPGDHYAYSNIGMAVLCNTICTMRAKTYESLLQEELFTPLKMKNTTTHRAQVQADLVQGYNWKGKATENWDLAALKGAGAVLSTTKDLSLYLKWSFEALRSELALMSQSTKNIDAVLEVALGWHIIKGYTDKPFLWHNGGTGGYKSSMGLNLANETGVIILTNIGSTNNPQKGRIDKLCYTLMETLDTEK